MMKIDEETGGKRKLSKRKDPESDVQYYISNGYPIEAVKEYLLNIANSNFYDWRKQNPEKELKEFEVKLEKLNKSGALFDMIKLNDVCKDYISRLDAKTVYDNVLDWSKEFNSDLYTQMVEHKDYFVSIFGIEREGSKVRKDIVKWSDVPNLIDIFFKESFEAIDTPTLEMDKETQKNILSDFMDIYHPGDTVEEWFGKVKNVATKNNFCTDYKEYEANPKKYKGKVGDVAMLLRVAITHKFQSPDLYQVMQVLGEEVVLSRLKNYKDSL
jgi:glutamyl-tRNA synthetase